MQAALFGRSPPKANIWIHFLSPILKSALVTQGEVPARSMKELKMEENPPVFLHDGTERPIRRPKEEEQQKAFYSGKKKAIP